MYTLFHFVSCWSLQPESSGRTIDHQIPSNYIPLVRGHSLLWHCSSCSWPIFFQQQYIYAFTYTIHHLHLHCTPRPNNEDSTISFNWNLILIIVNKEQQCSRRAVFQLNSTVTRTHILSALKGSDVIQSSKQIQHGWYIAICAGDRRGISRWVPWYSECMCSLFIEV